MAQAPAVGRYDLLRGAAPGEVLHIHGHGLGRGRVEARVEAQVADDEIDAPVPVAREVAGHDAIPPAVALLEPRGVPEGGLRAARVGEGRGRAPTPPH